MSSLIGGAMQPPNPPVALRNVSCELGAVKCELRSVNYECEL